MEKEEKEEEVEKEEEGKKEEEEEKDFSENYFQSPQEGFRLSVTCIVHLELQSTVIFIQYA